MIAIPNIIPIFALVHAKNCSNIYVVSVFLCSFEAVNRNDIRLSNPIGYSYVYVVSVLGGTGGDSLLYLSNIKYSFEHAKNQRNLFASEQQYLTSNARRSEIRRILTQSLSQRATSLRTAIRFHHRIALSRSYQSPFQENRTVLPTVGKTEPTQLPRQRLHSTERRAQLPLIFQLSSISTAGIIPAAWSPCGQTKKAVASPKDATAYSSIINNLKSIFI